MAGAEDTTPPDDLEALIDVFLKETPKDRFGTAWADHELDVTHFQTWGRMLALEPQAQAELVDRLRERLRDCGHRRDRLRTGGGDQDPNHIALAFKSLSRETTILGQALGGLLRRRLPLRDGTLVALLSERPLGLPLAKAVEAVAHRVAEGRLGVEIAAAAEAAAAWLRKQGPSGRKAADRLSRALGAAPILRIEPGEAWSDAALADLAAMPADRRGGWQALLTHCQAGGTGRPTDQWLKDARPLVEGVGRDDLRSRLPRWLGLVDRPRTVLTAEQWRAHQIVPHHVDLLKGLAWCAGLEADRDLGRALSALALSAYRKVPYKGPREPALGNAAVAALGMMPGRDAVGQLALLKVKVKSIAAQKEIDRAMVAAAEREGLPREEVEELAVPAYGLEEVGRRREVLGDYTAELVVEGSDVGLRWSESSDGVLLKSAPGAIKEAHADEVKELQAAAKEVAKMLSAQRERIDRLFLARKCWPIDAWRERYLDHPLVGTIARRLIWQLEAEGRATDGIWRDGRLVGADDRPLDGLGAGTTVELWHPIGRAVAEVLAWRDWLERHRVRQPFKQAHREVYVLTDAERATRVYSNRFAAHILRQHPFHALCTSRGWRDTLRMKVHDAAPPTSRDLPEWGLRAEFWVEGVGDEFDLNLATDQVRFYEIGAGQRYPQAASGGSLPSRARSRADPVPLDRVPPLVFSEIMRDVDLFVAVASVGNDPTWADGGPDGRHVDYWNRYSFGDLTANGQTRKAVLERLIPRLKIAPRCTFSDKFLVVRGDLRTYKIHLGSGNIRMEPNDQYLCIVANRGASESADAEKVFLPFEGDNTLSLIVSKALLLADDAKISDLTIISQIKR